MIIVINDSVQIGWNPRELPFCFHFIFVWVCLCVWKSFWFRLRTSKLRYWTVASSTIAAGCIAFGWEIDLNWQTRSGTARKSVGQNVKKSCVARLTGIYHLSLLRYATLSHAWPISDDILRSFVAVCLIVLYYESFVRSPVCSFLMLYTFTVQRRYSNWFGYNDNEVNQCNTDDAMGLMQFATFHTYHHAHSQTQSRISYCFLLLHSLERRTKKK